MPLGLELYPMLDGFEPGHRVDERQHRVQYSRQESLSPVPLPLPRSIHCPRPSHKNVDTYGNVGQRHHDGYKVSDEIHIGGDAEDYKSQEEKEINAWIP